ENGKVLLIVVYAKNDFSWPHDPELRSSSCGLLGYSPTTLIPAYEPRAPGSRFGHDSHDSNILTRLPTGHICVTGSAHPVASRSRKLPCQRWPSEPFPSRSIAWWNA